MSIAEKLVTIAENGLKVYEAGKKDGIQSEYDRFWDAYQDYGNRTRYYYSFAGYCWTDETYNPKYPINATANASSLFSYSSITDTKVPINLGTTATNKGSIFQSASKLVTIRELIWNCDIDFAKMFSSCTSLTNITLKGTITRDINMQWCPLTPESAWHVVLQLHPMDITDFMKYTVTFSAAVWEALDEYARENELIDAEYSVRDMIENGYGWRTA